MDKDVDSSDETSWNDWIGNTVENTREDSFATQPTHGFSKWYEKNKETDLAKLAAVETSSEEIFIEVIKQHQWTPSTSVTHNWNTSTDKSSLPTSKSPEGT